MSNILEFLGLQNTEGRLVLLADNRFAIVFDHYHYTPTDNERADSWNGYTQEVEVPQIPDILNDAPSDEDAPQATQEELVELTIPEEIELPLTLADNQEYILEVEYNPQSIFEYFPGCIYIIITEELDTPLTLADNSEDMISIGFPFEIPEPPNPNLHVDPVIHVEDLEEPEELNPPLTPDDNPEDTIPLSFPIEVKASPPSGIHIDILIPQEDAEEPEAEEEPAEKSQIEIVRHSETEISIGETTTRLPLTLADILADTDTYNEKLTFSITIDSTGGEYEPDFDAPPAEPDII